MDFLDATNPGERHHRREMPAVVVPPWVPLAVELQRERAHDERVADVIEIMLIARRLA